MKGEVAGEAPIKVEVEKGEAYFWCACGGSSNQPFCDGSHQGTEFTPVEWIAEDDGGKWFCACKQTDGEPFCDGSHNALSAEAESDTKVVIERRENGPLVVKGLQTLIGSKGEELECKPVMALCRCGHSSNKPFCDGSHQDAGFDSNSGEPGQKDSVIAYQGSEVTVHYNPLVCSHAAECVARLPDAFDPDRKPWIDPDKASKQGLEAAVAACPSGALQISQPDGDLIHIAGDRVAIVIEKNASYHVENAEIDDVEWAEGMTEKKYALCRCGLSGNKPFCDGTHRDEGWKDVS